MTRFFKAVFIAAAAFSVSTNAYDIGGGLDIGGGVGEGLDGGMMGAMGGMGGGYVDGGMVAGLGGIGAMGGMGAIGGYGDMHDPHYEAAIHSKRLVSVVPVQEKYEEPKIHSVSVEPAEMPLILNLKSKSSPLIVNAMHIGEGKGSIKKTKSVDAPHIRVHETLKPVLQEVREVVQPQRKIVQFISPVVQRINTFVTGHNVHGGGGGHGYGHGGYGGHEMGYFGPGHMGGGFEGEGGMIGGYGGGLALGGGGGALGMGMGGGYEGGMEGGKIGGLVDAGYEKGGEMLGGYSRSIKKITNVGRKALPAPKISMKRGKY